MIPKNSRLSQPDIKKIIVMNFAVGDDLHKEAHELAEAIKGCNIDQVKLLFPSKTQIIHGGALCESIFEAPEILFFFLDLGLSPDVDTDEDGGAIIHELVEVCSLVGRSCSDSPSLENTKLFEESFEILRRFVEDYSPDMNKPYFTSTTELGVRFPLDMCDEEVTYKYLFSKGAVHASGRPPIWSWLNST